MIHFQPLRTRRLTVQLRELSIEESVSIAAMPSHLDEATTTAFLRKAIDAVNGDSDPANWTVQERTMAVCHYLAAVSDDGPDFSVGDGGGKYSDYLNVSVDEPANLDRVELGEVGGDLWFVRHLTGAMVESVERLAGEIGGISKKFHWLLGCMAAQLVRESEDFPDPSNGERAFDDFLISRMRVMAAYPESDFVLLMSGYLSAREKLHHLFKIEFAEEGGLVVSPSSEGGAEGSLPPARFPVRNCITPMAYELVG